MCAQDSSPLLLGVGSSVVELKVTDPELATWLAATFADLSAEDAAPTHRLELSARRDRTVLWVDGVERHSSTDRSNVVDQLVAWCNQQAVISRPEMVNLHAAGLKAPGNGRCVVLPGVPSAGKSSVAAAAASRGWGYLSDELISLGPEATAHSYPKPITVKVGGKALVDIDYSDLTISSQQTRWYMRPAMLGGSVAEPSPVHALVFATFDPDHETTWEPISAAEALLELAANCQDELDANGDTLLRLGTIAATTVNGRLRQSDLAAAIDALEGVVATESPPPGTVKLLDPPANETTGSGPRVAPDAVAIALADGLVVHRPSTQKLVVLDPLAGTVWQLLDGTTPEPALADELATAFSHPPDEVAKDVRDLLDQLRSEGLLGNL